MVDDANVLSERAALSALRGAAATCDPSVQRDLLAIAMRHARAMNVDRPSATDENNGALTNALKSFVWRMDRLELSLAAVHVNNAVIELGGEGVAPA